MFSKKEMCKDHKTYFHSLCNFEILCLEPLIFWYFDTSIIRYFNDLIRQWFDTSMIWYFNTFKTNSTDGSGVSRDLGLFYLEMEDCDGAVLSSANNVKTVDQCGLCGGSSIPCSQCPASTGELPTFNLQSILTYKLWSSIKNSILTKTAIFCSR